MRLSSIALIALLLALALGCQKPGAESENRAPVRGSVKVAGKEATGLIVRFHVVPDTADKRASAIVEARTEADGTFRVSQTATFDGLAPGQYIVTFFWPPGGDADAPERIDALGGRYLKPEKSQFRIEIKSGDNDLPPFELK
jgi:hypothetical protein